MTYRMSTRRSALVTLLLTASGLLYVVTHLWVENPSLLYAALKGAGMAALFAGYGILLVHSFWSVVVKKDKDLWPPKRRKTDRKD